MEITLTSDVVRNLLDPNHADHLPYVEKAAEMFDLIKDLQKMKTWAFARLKWLSKRLNVSKRYVQKILEVLRNAHLIEVKRREKNYYRVNPILMGRRSAGRDSANDGKSQKRAARRQPDQEAQAPLEVEKNKTVEVEAPAPIEPAIEPMAAAVEPTVEPEIKEAVEEAAKEVRRELRYQRPKALMDYLSIVTARLTAWRIAAPRFLICEVVLQFWTSW